MTCGTVDLSNLEAIIDMVLTRNDDDDKPFFRALFQTRAFQDELLASYLALRAHQYSSEGYGILIMGWLVIGIELGLQQALARKPGADHDQN